MNRIKITVLMSVYNGEEFLKEAVDSILNQTFSDFEFLIINDGSTDNTAKILSSYRDNRIKVIDNKQNIGLTKSLNKGIKLANGKYIARLDADDIALKSRLKKQYQILENKSLVGLVSSLVEIIDKDGEGINTWDHDYSPEDLYYQLNFKNCLAHSSVMFKTSLARKLGGYNENYRYTQDFEFWIRNSKKAKIYLIPEILVKIRNTKSSLFYQNFNREKENSFQIVKDNLSNIFNRKLTDKEVRLILLKDIKTIKDFVNSLRLLNLFNWKLLVKEKQLRKKNKIKITPLLLNMTKRNLQILLYGVKNTFKRIKKR